MKKNISSKALMIKFKIEREGDNPLSLKLNLFFSLTYCVLTVVAIYFFIMHPSIRLAFIFIGLFLVVTIFLEVSNECLNTESIEFKIVDNQLIILRGSKVEKFEIDKCAIEYFLDKTSWLALTCDNQRFSFSLAQQPTKDLSNFIKIINQTDGKGRSPKCHPIDS
jgi:hypothetical protein